MSVLIEGFKFPDSCRNCRLKDFTTRGETYCIANGMTLAEDYIEVPTFRRADWCPLVELPEKHGDLIDRNKLIENKFKNDISYAAFVNLVKRQVAVVKAEGES